MHYRHTSVKNVKSGYPACNNSINYVQTKAPPFSVKSCDKRLLKHKITVMNNYKSINYKSNVKRIVWMLAFTTLMVAFAACDNDDDDGLVEPAEVAFVSLYNASPDAPDLDIRVDSRQINNFPFEYGDYTGYLRFFTGDRNFRFGPFSANNAVLDTTVTFVNGEVYSVFVADEYSDLGLLVLEDGTEDADDGMAMVRFIHLSPDAPEVSLAVEGETGAVVGDLTFMEGSDFIGIDPDEYDFEVRTSSDDNVTLSVPDVELQEGWFYTILILGYDAPQAGNSNVLSARVIVN